MKRAENQETLDFFGIKGYNTFGISISHQGRKASVSPPYPFGAGISVSVIRDA